MPGSHPNVLASPEEVGPSPGYLTHCECKYRFMVAVTETREFPLWLSGNEPERGSKRIWVRSLASLGRLRTWHCYELWCRLKTRRGSDLAFLWLWCRPVGTSVCLERGPKKTKKKKKKSGLRLPSSLPALGKWHGLGTTRGRPAPLCRGALIVRLIFAQPPLVTDSGDDSPAEPNF